jgi:hypothetical protein
MSLFLVIFCLRFQLILCTLSHTKALSQVFVILVSLLCLLFQRLSLFYQAFVQVEFNKVRLQLGVEAIALSCCWSRAGVMQVSVQSIRCKELRICAPKGLFLMFSLF